MKKKFALWGIGMLAGLFAVLLTGCEEEDHESYVPVFEGFSVYPNQPVSGDSVVFEAVQSQIGHLLYKAVYTWNFTYTVNGQEDLVTKTVTQQVVYDANPANPKAGFRLPEATTGQLVVTFSAEYSYSGQGRQSTSGGTYDNPSIGRYGSIQQVQSSQLFGVCRGRASLTVRR